MLLKKSIVPVVYLFYYFKITALCLFISIVYSLSISLIFTLLIVSFPILLLGSSKRGPEHHNQKDNNKNAFIKDDMATTAILDATHFVIHNMFIMIQFYFSVSIVISSVTHELFKMLLLHLLIIGFFRNFC